MRNYFFINIWAALIISITSKWSFGQSVHPSRQLSDKELITERLDLALISKMPEQTRSPQESQLVASLRVMTPEWRSHLHAADKTLLQDQLINEQLSKIAQIESQYDLLPYGKDVIAYAKELGVSREHSKKLKFYQGYELFKKKKYQAAIGAFAQVSKKKKEEYQYAQYYTVIAHIINQQYDHSLAHLSKIGHNKALNQYLLYYKAVNWYALSDYASIQSRLKLHTISSNGYQANALKRIIAYSAYLTKRDDASIQALMAVNTPSDTDRLLLGILSNRKSDYHTAYRYLSNTRPAKKTTNHRILFEKGIAAAGMGKNDEAIVLFTQLINQDQAQKITDIAQWNVGLLYAQQGQVDMAVRAMQNVKQSPIKGLADQWINAQIENINDTKILADLSRNLTTDNKGALHKKLYQTALNALRTNQLKAFESTFSILEKEATGSVYVVELSAIAGVKFIQEGNPQKGMSLLSKYLPNGHLIDHKPAAALAQYYIAYDQLNKNQTERSLGHFSKSLALLKRQAAPAKVLQKDILTRIGDIQLVQKAYRDADQSYQQAIAVDTKKSEYPLYQLSKIKRLLNSEYEQIIVLDQLLSSYTNGTYAEEARFDRANAYFSIGKYEKAQKDYQHVVSTTSSIKKKEASLMQLGLINVNAGDYVQATSFYKKVLNTSTNEANRQVATSALKEIYTTHDVDTDAYLSLTSKTEAPDKALFDLAKNNTYDSNIPLAIKQYEKLISDFPSSQYVKASYDQLTIIYTEKKSWDKVAYYIEKQLELEPNSEIAQQLIDITYNHLNDYERLINYSQKEWYPQSTQNELMLAMAHLNTGSLSKAEKLWTQQQNNESPIYIKLTGAIVDEYISQRKWNKIIQLNEKYNLHLTPKLIYSHALSLMNTEQYDAGISTITEQQKILIKDSAWLVKSVILIADMYFMQGDKSSAIGALEGMLSSDLTIPPSLKKQANDRLNSYNL